MDQSQVQARAEVQLLLAPDQSQVSGLVLPGLVGPPPHVVHHAVPGHLPAPPGQLEHFTLHRGQYYSELGSLSHHKLSLINRLESSQPTD